MQYKCAIYTRVSTDMQAEKDFNSCEAQEEKIKSFIKSQENMEVYKVYSDPGYTGANMNRPALNAIFQDVRDKKINLVIAYKIDRLTRSPRDFYQLIEIFEQNGVDFFSVTERFDTSTPSGRLLRNIMLTFAQFERELTSERIKDKMKQMVLKGLWKAGRPPFGYRVEKQKLVPHADEAKTVLQVFEMFIGGRSLFEITKHMKRENVCDGWGIPLNKTRIFRMIHNPVYIGKLKHNEEYLPGAHDHIISEIMFTAAQKVTEGIERISRKWRTFPLLGLLECGECHSTMTPHYVQKVKRGRRERYFYYRCTCTLKQGWDACSIRQVNANKLEDYLFGNLQRIALDRQFLENLAFRLNFETEAESSKKPAESGGKGYREGFELSPSSPRYTAETLGDTLGTFVKTLPTQKGIEKNLWAKKFIQRVIFSRARIQISLFYPAGCDNSIHSEYGLMPSSDFRGPQKKFRAVSGNSGPDFLKKKRRKRDSNPRKGAKTPFNRLAICRLRPLGHFSGKIGK